MDDCLKRQTVAASPAEPALSGFLLAVIDRIRDLLPIVRTQVADPRFSRFLFVDETLEALFSAAANRRATRL